MNLLKKRWKELFKLLNSKLKPYAQAKVFIITYLNRGL